MHLFYIKKHINLFLYVNYFLLLSSEQKLFFLFNKQGKFIIFYIDITKTNGILYLMSWLWKLARERRSNKQMKQHHMKWSLQSPLDHINFIVALSKVLTSSTLTLSLLNWFSLLLHIHTLSL